MAELPEHDVTALVIAARNGDRSAFDRLVTRFHKPLIGFLRALMPADILDAEALAQDTWIEVWKDISDPPEEGGFDPEKGTFFSFVKYRYAVYVLRRELSARAKRARQTCSTEDLSAGAKADPASIQGLWVEPVEQLEEAERAWLRLGAFAEVFRVVFLCGGYPHQQLALVFSAYIYGHCGNRAQEVHARHGQTRLAALADEFLEFSVTSANAGKSSDLSSFLQPLRDRIVLTVAQLMRCDKASLKCFASFSHQPVAQTCLSDYYADRKGGFTAAIPDWCYKVEKRVRHVLHLQGLSSQEDLMGRVGSPEAPAGPSKRVCYNCKLRNVPPCA